jgi:hypothetical protein
MDRNCNACGALNREEAKFCKSCGSPLPVIKKKLTQKEIEHAKNIQKFWYAMLVTVGMIFVGAFFLLSNMKQAKSLAAAKEYAEKYLIADDKAFGTIKPGDFLLEGISWKMSAADLKRNFPYATDSNDPDFKQSMMISQVQFITPIPHANFMSLGIYNGMLYAVKFEFGENEKFESQQFKVPNKDEIMYGRFMGLFTAFTKLYGAPAYEKNEIKTMPLAEKLKVIKRGMLSDGKPSNAYIAWSLGGTKAELAFFGYDGKLHLTVRFLNEKLWDQANSQQTGSYRGF